MTNFLPAITIKAKAFAAEITIFNVKDKDIRKDEKIAWAHITNNQSFRRLLQECGHIN